MFYKRGPMTTENQKTSILPTRELRDDAKGVFVNGDAHSITKSLSDRKVANAAFKSAFSDVFSGSVKASSLF